VAGALISYGASELPLFRRTAFYVDRLLRGTKPADLPVEQLWTFVLVINLKTAQALGITLPPPSCSWWTRSSSRRAPGICAGCDGSRRESPLGVASHSRGQTIAGHAPPAGQRRARQG